MKLLHDQPTTHDATENTTNATEAEQAADARLRDAAPELYEALEYFFNIMHDIESSRRKGYIKIAFDQARAALASAKAKPPRAVL